MDGGQAEGRATSYYSIPVRIMRLTALGRTHGGVMTVINIRLSALLPYRRLPLAVGLFMYLRARLSHHYLCRNYHSLSISHYFDYLSIS